MALRGKRHILIVTMMITMVAIPMIMVCKIIALVEYVLNFSACSCVILIISPVTLIVDVPIIHVELGLLQAELALCTLLQLSKS
jgi:hypothetical protein